MRIPHLVGLAALTTALVVAASLTTPAAAQSLTSGSLRGVVRGAADGAAVRGASLVLEGRLGGTIQRLETDVDGGFSLGLLQAGEYRLLIELLGFQPTRVTGIVVSAGETTVVQVDLERRPPPITEVKEVAASAGRVGLAGGRLIGTAELDRLDWHRAASDALRGTTEVVWPVDGRSGLGLAAAGLPISRSRVMVDGVFEPGIRHLGLPAEPLGYQALPRFAIDQIRIIDVPIDAEWRGTPGTIFAIQTRRGSDRVTFEPYIAGTSAALGGRAIDNPFDSTATSFQLGATLSGPIVKDTAHFLVRFDYQSLLTPTAVPWEVDTARYDGGPVSIRETLAAVAQDSFATSVQRHVTSQVRSWKGASGMAKLDWNLSATQRLAARFSFADWRERTPFLGEGVSLAAGAALKARDISGAAGITSTGGTWSNEFRAGFSTGRRDYDAAPLPETSIVTEGVAFGGRAILPAFFDQRTLDLTNAFQIRLGSSHRVKLGGGVTNTSYQSDYRFGGAGLFRFGDLTDFGAGEGTFYLADGSEIARFSSSEVGGFLQDTWQASPDVQLIAGIRYDYNPIPKNKISFADDWFLATGIRNDSLVSYTKAIAPRIGFVWDALNRGEWVMRGGLGLHFGSLDPAAFSEAMLYDGGVSVRRGTGTFASWPALPDQTLAPTVGPALTILNRTYRPPRAFKGEFGITRALRNGLTLEVVGSYHHTDYLLERTDLNRLVDPLGETQEGRPVFGTLRQDGGFVAPVPGTNRRFDDFDMVSGLSPTGFSDHYEVTLSVERRMNEALSFVASYTYSKTEDNLLGARSLDPADQLSPFPAGLDGAEWERGRSDFDVPHRLAATARYRTTGRVPVTVAARYRVRSGLPFTPGFRPGVDVNGDGSGGNDPVFLASAVAGLSEALAAGGCPGGLGNRFAERNSCRETMRQALDLHLSFGLPVGPARGRLLLQVDAFNVVGTATGIVDRAALLIDPAGTVITDGAGNVTLPLIANPHFGSLLARRGEPRLVRVGLRMEY